MITVMMQIKVLPVLGLAGCQFRKEINEAASVILVVLVLQLLVEVLEYLYCLLKCWTLKCWI